ncbi:MAG: hypothetical protein ACRDMZ_07490, partial [Solirubrobacteraceae bacterium]
MSVRSVQPAVPVRTSLSRTRSGAATRSAPARSAALSAPGSCCESVTVGRLLMPLQGSIVVPMSLPFAATLRRAVAILAAAAPAAFGAQRFEISFSSAAHAGPVTGRLILAIAKSNQNEPRLLISPRGPALFGLDIDQVRPDQPIAFGDNSLGFPGSLAELPPGDYFAQAIINVYEQVHRSDGKTIWV